MLRLSAKFFLAFFIWTIIGQIEWQDRTLENRYHEWVNHDDAQELIAQARRPFRWTFDQLAKLVGQEPSTGVR